VIIVVGSRHDPVAASLAASWPNAGLVSAEDLTSPGWRWTDRAGAEQWVVGGNAVSDGEVTGIYVRRSRVLPDELLNIHLEDRAYLAAESQAFLIAMLGSTTARVVNPVGDGALGDELVRPELVMAAARAAGLEARPLRLTSREPPQSDAGFQAVEVVGGDAFGDAPSSWRSSAVSMLKSLSLAWAVCVFDEVGQFVALTTSAAPSPPASQALAELLARKGE